MTIMNQEKILEELKKRIYYQRTHTWRNIISKTDVDNFISNFNDDEVLGFVLLDILIFHNQEQEKQLVHTLIEQLLKDIYKNINPNQDDNSEQINRKLKSKSKDICFIPVADKDLSDSSYAWSTVVKNSYEGLKKQFYSVDQLPLLLSLQKKYCVFYDDMIGTGEQFTSFITKKRFCLDKKTNLSILDLMDHNKETQLYYLCLAGYKDGIEKVKSLNDNIKVVVAERFDTTDSVLSPDNEYWLYYDKRDRDEIIKKVQDYYKSICGENQKFSRNIAVMFERVRPSNTNFPLYWCNNKNWKPLKTRNIE